MDKIIYLYLVQLCLRRRINGAKEMEKRERKKDERERERERYRQWQSIRYGGRVLGVALQYLLIVVCIISSWHRHWFIGYNLWILWWSSLSWDAMVRSEWSSCDKHSICLFLLFSLSLSLFASRSSRSSCYVFFRDRSLNLCAVSLIISVLHIKCSSTNSEFIIGDISVFGYYYVDFFIYRSRRLIVKFASNF